MNKLKWKMYNFDEKNSWIQSNQGGIFRNINFKVQSG